MESVNNDFVFSADPPAPKGRGYAKEFPPKIGDKPKRKYTRHAKRENPAESAAESGGETGGVNSEALVVHEPDARSAEFSESKGIQYLQALTRLLELIAEPQRSKLVDFIITEKIM